MSTLFELTVIFIFGAIAYTCIEILWRGHTHPTMTVMGGGCFVFIYLLRLAAPDLNILVRCLIGAAVISAAELAIGYVVNLKLGWEVWDYSTLKFNFMGQISLFYSFLWYLLAIAGDLLSVVFSERIFLP